MQTIAFEESILSELNEEPLQFEKDVHLGAAIWFYKNHKLTLGQASKMAGMSQLQFMLVLGENGIPSIDYDPEDLAREMEKAGIWIAPGLINAAMQKAGEIE